MSACVKCKGALKPKALFCTKCGTKVVEPAVAAAPVTPAPAPVAAVATSAVAAPKAATGGDCIKCAAKLKPNSVFCVKCGTKQEAGAAAASPAPRKDEPATAVRKDDVAAPAKSAAVVSPRKDVKTGEAAAKNVDVKSPGPTWAVVGSPPAGGAGGAMCVSCSNALKPGALFCTKCGTKTPVGKAPSAVTATPPSERGGEKQLDKSLGKIPTAAAEKPAEKSTGSIPVIVKAVAKTAPVAEREKDPPVPALMPKKTAEPLKDGPATSSTPPLESSGEGGSRKRSESLRRTTSVSMSTPPAPAAAVGAADGAAPEERRPRGSSIRSPRGESPPVVSVSTSPPVKLVEGDEVSEERRARKGSFRESVALPVTGSRTNLRESMMISAQDRDAAMEKINAMMGSDIPQTVKIACVLEGRVKKTLEVEAIDGIINGRSIQIAWNLSPEQEFHVTFVGLRAPNGEEIPFETSEEVPWPHIPFWEEVIFPDEVYEILYEDDRDVDVDNLTDAEVAKLEKEFDEMDVLKHGFLSREGLTRFFTDQCDRQLRDREGTIDRIMAPGGAAGAGGGRKDRGAKRLDPGILEHVTSQVNHVMAMDVAGSGRIELHEYARAVATEIVLMRTASRKSNRGKRLSVRISGVK